MFTAAQLNQIMAAQPEYSLCELIGHTCPDGPNVCSDCGQELPK